MGDRGICRENRCGRSEYREKNLSDVAASCDIYKFRGSVAVSLRGCGCKMYIRYDYLCRSNRC